MKRVYLATSYSHKWGIVRWWRYKKVTKCLGVLSARYVGQYNFFSPITHSHKLVPYIPERLNTHGFWLGIDFDWIDTCDEVWVYMQDGWDFSHGVNEELKYAKGKGMKVRYITDDIYYTIDEVR